jgi:adenylate cyclase
MASTRRLAAIFAADVAGYSRLMGVDEEGTHERFTAHLKELFTPRIKQHGGRIVKSTGDGMLAEFPSVVEAVLCAVEVQCGMNFRNANVAEERQLSFRIGINVGDVIAEPEDIFGDGVNIAARLESLAEPNGICISHAVLEQVRDKLPYGFDDIGEQLVKNIARPLHVFVLRPQTIASLPFSDATPVGSPAVSGGIVAGQSRPPRLSSVVLPFTNLSDDREDQYFADAITDDVTTDLSRISDMIVISSNTAFTYKDRRVDTRQIGRDLHVRYVFSGSVRRSGNRARVNVQLIDAETDAHVWAERFDYDSSELLSLQDDITSRIAVALNLELISAEAARPTEQPDTLDYILRGRAALYNYRGSTPESLNEAIQLFQQALAADRDSIEARALLALSLMARVLEQVATSPTSDIARAQELVETVVSMSPRHPLVNFLKGQLLRAQHQFEAAIPEYEAAISLNRNSVIAIATLGLCKFFTGAVEEAIPAQERAIRLSPRDPRLPNWYWRIGMVHLLQSRTDESIPWLVRARSANPSLPGPHAWLVSAYALNGELQRAAVELAEARRLSGDNRYISIASHKAAQPFRAPKILDLAERTFYAGLRKAGVPDKMSGEGRGTATRVC